ncbi:UDP-2,4-diacetamido-2,4,6-trideoxy-beta-L-altropyranose hydrolase [Roseibium sp. AS2]|uniref:UDP-2,4-diacetamido-2,4, 6-trideoxy-beta-L-altropyranose hydrolase n=1 Tax=Roseibium sp. AS2 TaxID=3135781 RepID=UPI003179A3FF
MTSRVGFRVDAAVMLGGGHVMRCLTLARTFRDLGHICTFLCSEETLEVIPEDLWDGFNVRTIASLNSYETDERYDLLVIDHYGIAEPEERKWRSQAGTLMVIDDLADRRHDCDLLLDQTYEVKAADYEALVPANCRMLLGTNYALLREEFAAHRPASLERRMDRPIGGRVLVSLGMTDVDGIAGRVCTLLKNIGNLRKVDVVLDRKAASHAQIRDICASDGRFQIHCDVRNMAELMLLADVAIGAGGTTTWERCAMGVPSIVLVLADNQTKIADLMNKAGAIGLLGDVRKDTDLQLSDRMTQFLSNAEQLRAFGKRSAALCDGAGARRVVEDVLQLVAMRKGINGYV